MFFIIGISIAVFLELLLLIKKNKSRADKILFIWLFLIAVHQLLNYILFTGEVYNYPHWLGVQFSMPILHGVLLYFYVMEITGKKLNNRWTILLHLIPTFSLILLAIPFYILSGEQKISIFQNEGAGFEWYIIYLSILIPLSGLIYSVWSLILIKKHQKNIQDRFSNTDKKELQWLQYLSIGYGIIWVLAIFFEGEIIFTAVVVMVLFMGFFGINQLNIFVSQGLKLEKIDAISVTKDIKSKKIKTNISTKRYAKSGLNEEMAAQIYTKLNEFMIDDTIYKKRQPYINRIG